jgi:hypothetical protein
LFRKCNIHFVLFGFVCFFMLFLLTKKKIIFTVSSISKFFYLSKFSSYFLNDLSMKWRVTACWLARKNSDDSKVAFRNNFEKKYFSTTVRINRINQNSSKINWSFRAWKFKTVRHLFRGSITTQIQNQTKKVESILNVYHIYKLDFKTGIKKLHVLKFLSKTASLKILWGKGSHFEIYSNFGVFGNFEHSDLNKITLKV